MTFEQSRAYIEQGRRLHQRRKRIALLSILGGSLALWGGLIAVGWAAWHYPWVSLLP
jgi:hypothetical protein